jgi:hypothetical protein
MVGARPQGPEAERIYSISCGVSPASEELERWRACSLWQRDDAADRRAIPGANLQGLPVAGFTSSTRTAPRRTPGFPVSGFMASPHPFGFSGP